MEKVSTVKPSALLVARHLRLNPKTGKYEEIDKREACGVVTDVFVQMLVDLLQAEVIDLTTFNFHDSGTGITVPEAAGDVGLETPVPGIARVEGSQEEGATANIYMTIATITYDGDYEITEHGVFDALEAGNLMDRTVFGAITVEDTDQIEFTYRLTCPSGG